MQFNNNKKKKYLESKIYGFCGSLIKIFSM